ncbi:hypothetical protein AAF712_012045 [Marasmius tenuissimus]|uniref:Myosin motor domain-containing protein n=1 Tax=Marasmius tenuissimus TaxID=585030 RepID=A0ABR2ZHJ0_9AGAR
MKKTTQDQAIVFSGETGSGKSESRRLAIKTILEVSVSSPGKKGSKLTSQVPAADFVLKSFGNARTPFNPNTSRFEKYSELQFSDRGQLTGLEYYLEKNRVAGAPSGEQNFHIFYYLVAGASAEERAHLHLDDKTQYRYLGQWPGATAPRGGTAMDDGVADLQFLDRGRLTGAKTLEYYLEKNRVAGAPSGEHNFHIFFYLVAGISAEERAHLHLDNKTQYRYLGQRPGATAPRGGTARDNDSLRFEQLKVALKTIGFSKHHVAQTCQLLAAILHLGNLKFTVDRHRNEACLSYKPKLVKKKMCTGFLDPDSASDNRDELTKSLYFLLFVWLNKHNQCLCKDDFSNHSSFKTGSIDRSGYPTFTVHHFNGPVTYSSENFLERNQHELNSDFVSLLRGGAGDAGAVGVGELSFCIRGEHDAAGVLGEVWGGDGRSWGYGRDGEGEGIGEGIAGKDSVWVGEHGYHTWKPTGLPLASGLPPLRRPTLFAEAGLSPRALAEPYAPYHSPGLDAAGGDDPWAASYGDAFSTSSQQLPLVSNASPFIRADHQCDDSASNFGLESYAPSRNMFHNAEKAGLANEQAFPGEVQEGETTEVVKESSAHHCWVALCWILTWWLPNPCLTYIGRMKRLDIQQVWREKLALNIMIWFACACAIFVIAVLGLLICPTQHVYSTTELTGHSFQNIESSGSLSAPNGEVSPDSASGDREFMHPVVIDIFRFNSDGGDITKQLNNLNIGSTILAHQKTSPEHLHHQESQ